MFLVLVSCVLVHYDSSLVLHGLDWFLFLWFQPWYLCLQLVLSSPVLADYTWFSSGFCWFILISWVLACFNWFWVHFCGSDLSGSTWFGLVLIPVLCGCSYGDTSGTKTTLKCSVLWTCFNISHQLKHSEQVISFWIRTSLGHIPEH